MHKLDQAFVVNGKPLGYFLLVAKSPHEKEASFVIHNRGISGWLFEWHKRIWVWPLLLIDVSRTDFESKGQEKR